MLINRTIRRRLVILAPILILVRDVLPIRLRNANYAERGRVSDAEQGREKERHTQGADEDAAPDGTPHPPIGQPTTNADADQRCELNIYHRRHAGAQDRIQVEINFLMRACALPPRVLAAAPAIRDSLEFFDTPNDGALALMRRLKAAFDPAGIFNPGCFVGGI